jgi:hypothetical protein
MLSAEGRLRRAGTHRGDLCFATEGNAVNPRIGSGLQDGRGVVEEQAVEVVRNHEDGTRMGTGIPIPKGDTDGAGTLCTGLPGEDSPAYERWRGDLWTTPREETRCESRVARTGTRR